MADKEWTEKGGAEVLDRRTKRQIEWAFYNYKANSKLGAEQVQEIAEQGLTADLERIGFGSGIGNPTENKALRLQDRAKQYLWAKVVENTYIAFRWKGEGRLIKQKYEEHKTRTEIQLSLGISDRTYDYWVNNVLLLAERWAYEMQIL